MHKEKKFLDKDNQESCCVEASIANASPTSLSEHSKKFGLFKTIDESNDLYGKQSEKEQDSKSQEFNGSIHKTSEQRFFSEEKHNIFDVEELDLRGQDNKISELKGKNCPNLKILDLGETNIEDISFLNKFKTLEELYLDDTQVKDIQSLENLPLKILRLTSTPLEDITPLTSLKDTLLELNISDTKIKDFSPLFSLKNLKVLCMTDVNIKHQEIFRLKKLGKLEQLYIDGELQAIKADIMQFHTQRREKSGTTPSNACIKM